MPLAPEIKKAGHTADPVPDPQASRPFGSTGPAPEAGPQARPDPAPAKPVQPEPAGGRVPMPVPPAPAPAPAPAPRSEQPRTEALLGDIRQQLQDLNRNMARLEQTVQNAAAAPCLDPVLERIDAARTRLEGMLSAGTRQAEPQADPDLGDKLQKMQELLESIGARQERNDRQLSQCLRENANFQVQVRQGMQRDMEKMRVPAGRQHLQLPAERDRHRLCGIRSDAAEGCIDSGHGPEEPDDDVQPAGGSADRL